MNKNGDKPHNSISSWWRLDRPLTHYLVTGLIAYLYLHYRWATTDISDCRSLPEMCSSPLYLLMAFIRKVFSRYTAFMLIFTFPIEPYSNINLCQRCCKSQSYKIWIFSYIYILYDLLMFQIFPKYFLIFRTNPSETSIVFNISSLNTLENPFTTNVSSNVSCYHETLLSL